MSLLERVFGERVIVADSGQGLYRASSNVKHFAPSNLVDYFEAYTDYDLIRAPVDDLVEQSVGMGFHTVAGSEEGKERTFNIGNDDEPDKAGDPYWKAKEVVDQWCKDMNIDSKLGNITRINLIAGFCPVETIVYKKPEKNSMVIIHPLTVDKAKDKGIEWTIKDGVTKVHQKVGNKESTVEGKDLAWFNYCQIGNNPIGISYVRGMLPLLNTINSATSDIDRILKRYVGPMAIWKTRRSIDSIKRAVEQKAPGEDLFLGNLSPDEYDNAEFPKIMQIDPRVPFWDWIEYLDRRIFAYSRASNIWYFKDATVASAREMEDIVQRHVSMIQRDLKRTIERDWFSKVLTAHSIDLKYAPKVVFGIEKTGVEDIEPSEIIMKGLDYGYLDQEQYYSILRQMGITVTKPSKIANQGPENPPTDVGTGDTHRVKPAPGTPDQMNNDDNRELMEMVANRDPQANAVFDIVNLMRFHSQDMVVDESTLSKAAKTYCWRYGINDESEQKRVIARVSALLELEGYTLKDGFTQRKIDEVEG